MPARCKLTMVQLRAVLQQSGLLESARQAQKEGEAGLQGRLWRRSHLKRREYMAGKFSTC